MTCTPIYQNGKRIGFICSRGRSRTKPCVECGSPSTKLCDFPLKGKRAGKTCDRPLCDACAVTQPNVTHIETKTPHFTETPSTDTFDLCPAHARATEEQRATESLFTDPTLGPPITGRVGRCSLVPIKEPKP